jgi:ABC-type sulfate transport system permease component
MILLYTAVNVSLAVWLLKGFIDEIPREYEEAAMVDGYTRCRPSGRWCCRRPPPASQPPPSSA